MRILVVVVSLVLASAAVGYVLLDTDNDEIEALQVEIAQLRTDLANLQIQEPPSTSTTVAPATTPPPPTSTSPPPTSTFAVVTTTTKAPPTQTEVNAVLLSLSDMPLGWSPVQVSPSEETIGSWCADSALWKVLTLRATGGGKTSRQPAGGTAARSCFANGLQDPVYRVRLEVAGLPEISQATDLLQEPSIWLERGRYLHSLELGVRYRAYSFLLSSRFRARHTTMSYNTAKLKRGVLEVYESALGPEGSVTRVSDVKPFDHPSGNGLDPLTREISITHNVGYCVLNMHLWVRNEEETALYFDEDSFGLAAAIAEMFMTDINESLEECMP